jgi:hypothetical protein
MLCCTVLFFDLRHSSVLCCVVLVFKALCYTVWCVPVPDCTVYAVLVRYCGTRLHCAMYHTYYITVRYCLTLLLRKVLCIVQYSRTTLHCVLVLCTEYIFLLELKQG